ncbi:hypothetical protein CCACVL1_10299 [Corchorus capsularis]|uniref:Uncharacterized protein n=1 Tax=Corchorus capsularis TaxID=210143 RepID=A0A1R3IRT7_COCAP|nr:hypothetical protein CCACVL1_10299 [Corchorus capsularis]
MAQKVKTKKNKKKVDDQGDIACMS